MAPIALTCPLCCNETFSSHSSLKYHILSMIDNLLCPSCDERCDDFMDLADHLGRECKNLKKSSNHEHDENTLTSEANNTRDESKDVCELSVSKKVPIEAVKIKVENENELGENSETGNNIIDIDESGNVNEKQVEKTNEQDSELYTCQMCNISFNSVQEHLAKYHEGEEVLLETEQEENVDSQGEEGSLMDYQGTTDDDADDDIFEDEGSIMGNSEANAGGSGRSSSLMGQTIAEQELVDKNGMNYTRKMIKVGNEWPCEDIQPNTTKYIVEDGKVRRMTEEEADEIDDKSKIIEVHSCPNCNLQFPNLSHFKKHNCNNAKPITSKRRDKKNQLLKIKEELRYQCTFCLAIYSSLIALNDHMKSHLIQDESGMVQKKTITMSLHVCDVCNTKFPTYKQLRLHTRMHDPVKDKQVDPPVSYNILGQSNDDNEESGNIERETFQCPICDNVYDKEYEEVHMKSHENRENIVCLVCNRKFDRRDNLEMHMKAHSNTKKFACSYCKKPFNSYKALEDHVMNQCQIRHYECQYCGRKFSRPHEKVKHERIHTGEKPHVCQLCGRAFRVSYCLTLHMRTHSNTRPYTCQHCGKRFKSHSVFNHHMQTHSDERNYKCPFCPKAFKTAVQLAGHKNSHTKPFSCTECNRPFASLYAVRAHMETHKRDNNLKFDCWVCGASYARSFALRDHMSSVHGDATEKGQDDNVLIKLENANGSIQTASEDQHMEGEVTQILAEGEEYHVATNEDEVCQVLANPEEAGSEGYVVHLQEIENSDDTQMET